ncbi:MAG: Crp/Fnr family transcriptional regulator [bacterium]|nr:Crp/Fnr family transcriptional regulator [bacterium]
MKIIKTEKMEMLRSVPIFSQFDEEELANLAEIVKIALYKKGEWFFSKDDVGTYLFVIQKGLARVVVEGEDVREVTLSILQESSFFGEMSILDGKPRSATVIAQEDCSVLVITRNSFLKFIKQYPSVGIKILTVLCQRLRKTDQQVETLAFLKAEQKVADVLLKLKEEYGKKTEEGLLLDIKLTHSEIGSLAGMTRETSNRVLSRFIKRGWIKRIGKKIMLLDQMALYKEIQKKGGE